MKKVSKKREKAFTLIELLAVIIILAIVALIATPIILNVVDDARSSAGKSESNMILNGINNYCATEDMKYQLDNSYIRKCTSDMTEEDVKDMVNLGSATIEEINYDGDTLLDLKITSNNHTYTLCLDKTFAKDNEECPIINKGSIKNVVLSNFPYLKTKGNGCLTQTDNNYSYMGGCYLKSNVIQEPDEYGENGISEHPTTNYIWYSGFLWRIMGINADGTVRMITEENITSIAWGEEKKSNNWDGSHIKEWLNDYFYNHLKGNNIITEQTWCSETTDDNTSSRTICANTLSITKSKVGLITLDEYNLAGGQGSYLNTFQSYWTMTRRSSNYANEVDYFGSVSTDNVSYPRGVRVVINVNSDATITGGNGTLGAIWSNENGPYVLNEEKYNIDITGKLNEKATSGEYVLFAGKKYRVVSIDNNGNTKLMLDGYYEETEGTIYEMKYSNRASVNNFMTSSGIGQKLNTDVLNWLVAESDTTNRNKLITNYTWYQNKLAHGNNYKISLEETNPTRTINATVGLIRVGEMLSGQISIILSDRYTTTSIDKNTSYYWTMTQASWPSIWIIGSGEGMQGPVANTYYLRPVIVINSNVTITQGNGTWSSPYEI